MAQAAIEHTSSDQQHNLNCFHYFQQLLPFATDSIEELLPALAPKNKIPVDEYDKQFPYGDLYSKMIADLEALIERDPQEENEELNQFIEKIFDNDNHSLDQEQAWFAKIGRPTNQRKINQLISKTLKNGSQSVNKHNPKETGTIRNRLHHTVSRQFKTLHGTNVASVRHYAYKDANAPIEYRFGTQAQRHNNKPRISPLFERWLKIRASKHAEKDIVHIYFNNLPRDRQLPNIPGYQESLLTAALDLVDNDSSLKTLVITLPAHEGNMETTSYQKTDDALNYQDVFDEFLSIAMGEEHPSGITDFYISPRAKELLYVEIDERTKLTDLLQKSFHAQGLEPHSKLTTAQKQAVWVHFLKFELTDYIISAINPVSYNFSCKDAIDRGGVSSLYFNLMKSLQKNAPMQRKEFELAINAPAVSVKGRGMNFHRQILWNALDSYINANYEQLNDKETTAWLIYWRDQNCPDERADKLLVQRLLESYELLDKHLLVDSIENHTREILAKIVEFNNKNMGNKTQLLDAVSRTMELVTQEKTPDSIALYKEFAEKIQIENPILKALSGLMEMLAGALLYILSAGCYTKTLKNGYTSTKTGFFASKYKQLSDEMINLTDDKDIIPAL